MQNQALTLMAVHAHPDDEAIGTGGILARYAAEGVRTVVVTCTRGELGDVQDPSYVPPRPGMDILAIREEEMAEALKILNVTAHHNLGYKDSGMAGTSGNDDPEAFCRTDVEAAARRLVVLVRRERPQVVVTYDENGLYGHPDHIMANRITGRAFALAGDPDIRLPEAETPWQPRKLYHLAIPNARLEKYRRAGQQQGSPKPPSSIVGTPEAHITTRIDIRPVLDTKFEAIFAHRSQIAAGHIFRKLSAQQRAELFGGEHFVCVRGCPHRSEVKESDLFAGLR